MIKKVFKSPKSIYAILLLGIFTFLFLGAEYFYVNMISLTAGEEKTVIAQNYTLGISAIGFLLYPLFHRFFKKKVADHWAFSACIGIGCMQFFGLSALFLYSHTPFWDGPVPNFRSVGKRDSLPFFQTYTR